MNDLFEFIMNVNLFPAILGFIAAVIGGLISQVFQVLNMRKVAQIRIASLAAEERYKVFQSVCSSVSVLDGSERGRFLHLFFDFSKVNKKNNLLYHQIFNSWEDLNCFFNIMHKTAIEHGHLYTPKLRTYNSILEQYYFDITNTAGNGYRFTNDTLWIFGVFCFVDLNKFKKAIYRECYKFICKPDLKIRDAYSISNKLISRFLVNKYYNKSDLKKLNERITIELGSLEPGKDPMLFMGWDDLLRQCNEERTKNQTLG
jgi:hypothetical protein